MKRKLQSIGATKYENISDLLVVFKHVTTIIARILNNSIIIPKRNKTV